jgi:hypothetical protein
MPTVFALVGQDQTGLGRRPYRGGNDRDRDVAAAAREWSGEIAGLEARTRHGRERWVERLLVALSVALAVATWTLLSGSVIR